MPPAINPRTSPGRFNTNGAGRSPVRQTNTGKKMIESPTRQSDGFGWLFKPEATILGVPRRWLLPYRLWGENLGLFAERRKK